MQRNEHEAPKVFISYSNYNVVEALKIAAKLRELGVNSWLDIWEVDVGDSWQAKIEEAITSSNSILVLLSPDSVTSDRTRNLLIGDLSKELKARAVSIIPVLISDCEIPFDLPVVWRLDVNDLESGIIALAKRFWVGLEINFSEIDEAAFVALVGDLLIVRGFTGVSNQLGVQSYQFDLKAELSGNDPFGSPVHETWLIEVKLYRNGRVDLSTLKQFAETLRSLPLTFRGLIVTNGQLTSVAENWLTEEEARTRTEIRVIDGVELKRLLIAHPSIVEKYFIHGGQQ